MPPQILRPGPGANGGPGDPNAPALVTCNACGHQILLPQGLAQVASEQHTRYCIGGIVRHLMDTLCPPSIPTTC